MSNVINVIRNIPSQIGTVLQSGRETIGSAIKAVRANGKAFMAADRAGKMRQVGRGFIKAGKLGVDYRKELALFAVGFILGRCCNND